MSITKLTPEDRQSVIDRFRDPKGVIRCAMCGNRVTKGGFDIDHIIPEFESTPEQRTELLNMQVLCNPKGGQGCHKKKTAAEAKRYARANKPVRDWTMPGLLAFSSVATAGCGLAGTRFLPVSETHWLALCGGFTGAAFLTFLVQNAFEARAPQENDSPKKPSASAPPPEETALVARLHAAAREVMGPKGIIRIRLELAGRAFVLSYADTGFPDHDKDKRFDVLEKIQAKTGQRWIPDWRTQDDEVRFARRPDLPAKIPHPGLRAFPNRPWNVLPVAPEVAFDLTVTPHVLIAGETNAGKTAMQRAMIAAALDSAVRDDSVEVTLIDPKRIEFLGYRDWPGVRRIVSETEDLWDIAFEIEDEMNRRYYELEANKVPMWTHKKWIIFFDEFEQYKIRVERHWLNGKDEDGKPLKKTGQRQAPPLVAIGSVLAMARKCGIYLMIATQSPDADVFGKSGIRQNLPGRATVGAIDVIRAKMMYNDAGVGRDIPSSAKGRATFQIGDGQPIEAQTYYVPDPADADPNYRNTPEDWDILLRLGMPQELIPA
jgi:hypothetical protein